MEGNERGGESVKARLMRKRYKAALTRIAEKIPAAFASKDDKRRWISAVTKKWVMDRKVVRT